MSLTTTSAATALWTVLADDPDNNGREGRRWEDQTGQQRDLYTQIAISSALGLGAFLSFCVWIYFLSCRLVSVLLANSHGPRRCCGPNGKNFMLHGENNAMLRPIYPSYRIASLGGFQFCTGSPRMKFCSPLDWTHTWCVFCLLRGLPEL